MADETRPATNWKQLKLDDREPGFIISVCLFLYLIHRKRWGKSKLNLSFKSSLCCPSFKKRQSPGPWFTGSTGWAPGHLSCPHLLAASSLPLIQPRQLLCHPSPTTGTLPLQPWVILSSISQKFFLSHPHALPKGLPRPPYLENTSTTAFSITLYPLALLCFPLSWHLISLSLGFLLLPEFKLQDS